MSFLSELKKQANALQRHHHGVQHEAAANLSSTKLAKMLVGRPSRFGP